METFTILITTAGPETHLVAMLGPDPETAAETAATLLLQEIEGEDFLEEHPDWRDQVSLSAWSGLHDDPPTTPPDYQRKAAVTRSR